MKYYVDPQDSQMNSCEPETCDLETKELFQ